MSLFDLVVGLNCEDVMFWLVFRHLISLRHLLPSRRDSIREPDLHGRAAQKFLALSPICTQEAAATYQASMARGGAGIMPHSGSVSFSQIFSGLSINNSSERRHSASASDDGEDEGEHYYLYLRDARRLVRACSEACANWQYEYDGVNPPPNALDHNQDDDDEEEACDNESAAPETAASSGYTSLVQQQQQQQQQQPTSSSTALVADDSLLTSEEDREFWNLMRDPAVPEARLNRVIRKMQAADAVSNNSSLASSSEWSSPRDALVGFNRLHLQGRRSGQFIGNSQQEDVDLSITSLGELPILSHFTLDRFLFSFLTCFRFLFGPVAGEGGADAVQHPGHEPADDVHPLSPVRAPTSRAAIGPVSARRRLRAATLSQRIAQGALLPETAAGQRDAHHGRGRRRHHHGQEVLARQGGGGLRGQEGDEINAKEDGGGRRASGAHN